MSTTITQHTVDAPLAQIIREIEKQHGASVSAYPFAESCHKFGRNAAVGTSLATVMTLAGTETNETYGNIATATNFITQASSSSTADGETITVVGHTVSGGVLTKVTQNVILNGQSIVALTTPLARVERAFNISATTLAGSVYLAETVTVSSGVPTTANKVHLVIAAGKQQSRKAALSTADGQYLVITSMYISTIEKAANSFADGQLEIRTASGVFRERGNIASGSGTSSQRVFYPPLIVPPNCDVRLRAAADGVDTDVAGGFDGYYLTTIT